MMQAYDSFLVLSAQDENCAGYVGIYGPKEAEKKRQKEILKAAAVNQAARVEWSGRRRKTATEPEIRSAQAQARQIPDLR